MYFHPLALARVRAVNILGNLTAASKSSPAGCECSYRCFNCRTRPRPQNFSCVYKFRDCLIIWRGYSPWINNNNFEDKASRKVNTRGEKCVIRASAKHLLFISIRRLLSVQTSQNHVVRRWTKICSVINLFRVTGSAGRVVFTSRREPPYPLSTPAAQNARREEDSVRKPLKFHFFDKGVEYRAIRAGRNCRQHQKFH